MELKFVVEDNGRISAVEQTYLKQLSNRAEKVIE
jgi:uncharacterized Fe-S cluster-containing radical SAM superfamily protein